MVFLTVNGDLNCSFQPGLSFHSFNTSKKKTKLKMKYESVFITGANRGIGLEFIKQLTAKDDAPSLIFATYRNADTLQQGCCSSPLLCYHLPFTHRPGWTQIAMAPVHGNVVSCFYEDRHMDLKTLQENSTKSRVILIKMDVNDPEAIEVARQIVEANVGDEGLHLLINNSAVAESLSIHEITAENMIKHFITNTVAPTMIAKALLPLLEKPSIQENGYRSAILNISSTMGSIQMSGSPFDNEVPSYKISKAALNMTMKINASALKEKNILVVMMCPGWVKTDMGGKEIAELEPQDSISAMIKTLGELNAEHHGVFVNRFGKPTPF